MQHVLAVQNGMIALSRGMFSKTFFVGADYRKRAPPVMLIQIKAIRQRSVYFLFKQSHSGNVPEQSPSNRMPSNGDLTMYKRILVPTDGSPTAARGLQEAIKLAKNQKARIGLVYVVDQALLVQYPEASLYAADLEETLEQQGQHVLKRAEAEARRHGLRTETILHKKLAPVAEVIVSLAKKWRADVIVLGTHGRRGINRMLMGSDAELVVRNAPVPVLLVRLKSGSHGRNGK